MMSNLFLQYSPLDKRILCCSWLEPSRVLGRLAPVSQVNITPELIDRTDLLHVQGLFLAASIYAAKFGNPLCTICGVGY